MILYQLSTVRHLLYRSGVAFDILFIYVGSGLNVCGSYVQGLQCCSQMNENALGMTLNNALNTPNVDDLGIEVRAMQSAVRALYYGLTGKLCYSMI